MSSDRPVLSSIFPAYNEAHAIGAALEETLAFVQARNLSAEIIVVDDGSRDGTGATPAIRLSGRWRPPASACAPCCACG